MNIKNCIYLTMAFPLMLLALVGCSKDDDDTSDTRMPISFSGLGSEEITRAGEVSLSEYITDFTVYGINGNVNGESFSKKFIVFPDYQVWYTANSANTTSSNSSNWEYVGTNKNSVEQTIKYWDENTDRHYFWAVGNASKDINKVVGTNGLVDTLSVEVNNDDVKDRNNSLYYSDPKCVGNADYNKPVQLTFHDFASKIRVGFYESVEQPSQTENSGKLYKVTGLQFFGINENDGSFTTTASENVCLKGDFVEKGTVDITYDYDYTKMVANASVTPKINKVKCSFGTLNGVSETTPLTTSSANALFATNVGEQYTYVIPYNNTKGLTIKCNVKVESDTNWQPLYATVPATYTNWQPNHSYTYIFKIVSAKDQTIIMLDDVLIDNWRKGGSQDEDEWKNW
ncbi:MAG: hypothetical protein MJY81_08975 [Bacteroidaceae bacterium]|nr:hypothetical protein [Bacteroidaceae bacterium]